MDGNPTIFDMAAFGRHEARRLAQLEAQELTPVASGPVGLWDHPPDGAVEPIFAEIVAMARLLTGAEMAAFSVLDHDRAWFRARVGADLCSLPRSMAYCTYTVRREETVEIPDTRLDPEFADNPLTLGYEGLPPVLSYAGVPLYSAAPERACVGTLCVFGSHPHALSPEARAGLVDLAHHLEHHLHARERARREPLTGFYHAPVMADLVRRAAQRLRHGGGSLSVIGVASSHPIAEPATRRAFASRVGAVLLGHGELAGATDTPGMLLLLLPGSAPVHARAIAEDLRAALRALPGLLADDGRPLRFGLGVAGHAWAAGRTGTTADEEAAQVAATLARSALQQAVADREGTPG